jgi:riboflavin biosynthesis pyrimidine reductase
MSLRVLVGPVSDDLAELYAVPLRPWLRVNMVSTLDGAATGETGTSGSINNAVDRQVFHHLRAAADVIVVGAGTARAEGYRPADTPIVVVSRRGDVPQQLRGAAAGSVLVATCEAAAQLDEARDLLGESNVLVLGSHRVDLQLLKQVLADRGWQEILCEGGPHLLRDLLASGVADEICATLVPRVVAGEHPRITRGAPVDVPLHLRLLLESEGTLLGRWITDSGESRRSP